MASVAAVLGHDEISSQIIDFLITASRRTALLSGPSGSGKTYLAKSIGEKWHSAGGCTLLAQGDDLFSSRSHSPFLRNLTEVQASESADLVDRYLEVRLQDKAKGRSIFDQIFRLRKSAGSLAILNKDEQQVLLDIERRVQGRQLLLILDNLHWFDTASLQFVATCLSDSLLPHFDFVERMRVLAVRTQSKAQPPVSPKALKRVLSSFKRRWRLTYTTRKKFPRLLSAMGCENLPSEEMLTLLYERSRGHLDLASRLAFHLNSSDEGAFTARFLDESGLLDALLKEQLNQLGKESEDSLRRILTMASVIGSSFHKEELRCLSEDSGTRLAGLLQMANDLVLIRIDDSKALFAHEVIRNHFARAAGRRATEYHLKYAECLQILQPGEFLFRHYHLELGGSEKSEIMLVLAFLQCLRDGRPPRRILGSSWTKKLGNKKLRRFIKFLRKAYHVYFNSDFRKAISILKSLDFDYPNPLLAEKDYLEALCLTELHTKEGRRGAVRILESWTRLDEYDIRSRLRLLQLHALVLLGDFEDARRLRTELVHEFSERASFDPGSRDRVHLLNRRSGAIDTPEVATRRIRRAVKYFGPNPEGDSVRNPMEYYKSLSNLSGNLVERADYEKAYRAVEKVEAFVEEMDRVVFPRMDVPANNKVIAAYRTGRISAQEALRLQGELARSPQAMKDSTIQRINETVYCALNGDLEGALEMQMSIDDEMTRDKHDESYLVFFLKSNLIATYFLLGHKEDARRTYEYMTGFIRDLRWPTQPYVAQRHNLLPMAFDSLEKPSPEAWDRYILDTFKPALGPSWRHYGYGFLLCDLQFWAES